MKEATPGNVLGSVGSIPTAKHRALGGAARTPPLATSRHQSPRGKHTGHLARLPSWREEAEARPGVGSALHDRRSSLSCAAARGPHPSSQGNDAAAGLDKYLVMPSQQHNKGAHMESETGKLFPRKVASPAPAVRTLHLSVSECADPRPLLTWPSWEWEGCAEEYTPCSRSPSQQLGPWS